MTENITVMISWPTVGELFKRQWFDVSDVGLCRVGTESGCVSAGGRDPGCRSVCCYRNCAGNLLLQSQEQGWTEVSLVRWLIDPLVHVASSNHCVLILLPWNLVCYSWSANNDFSASVTPLIFCPAPPTFRIKMKITFILNVLNKFIVPGIHIILRFKKSPELMS